MSEELAELYQELIIDHYKNPRCKGCLEKPSAQSTLFNPLCGDEVSVQVKVCYSPDDLARREGRVSSVRFTGKGCSISQASASMMSELCEGKTVQEAKELVGCFTHMMKDQVDSDDLVQLGDAASLQGVKRFAARIRCAMLGWEAIDKCLTSASERSKKSDKSENPNPEVPA